MAQPESSFKNMFLALFLVTLVAAGMLGLVNETTRSAIASSEAAQQSRAISDVLPPFASLGSPVRMIAAGEKDSLEFIPAYGKDGSLVAVAVKTFSNKGFSGRINIMVGLKADGTVSGFRILSHRETPGLGSRMEKWFSDKLKARQNVVGLNPEAAGFAVSKDGGNVDAITAATISSRAFLESIRKASENWHTRQMPAGNMPGSAQLPAQKEGGER